MRNGIAVHNRISVKILAVLLMLFSVASIVVILINRSNIRRMYEESFTERVLLTNALMAITIDSGDVNYFVELMKNQSDEFKQKQVQYYHDRLQFWQMQEEGAAEEELKSLSDRLRAFHDEMSALKSEKYWQTIDVLKHLKQVSSSTYLYVMADTGIVNNDGEPLYTFIFDAADNYLIYDDEPDIDGLGTSDVSQDTIKNVYETKKQMDHVEYYNDVYGELYYAFAPIFNELGDVIAVFATDLDLAKMNSSIAASTLLFNAIFFAIIIFMIVVLFAFLHRSIVKPLGLVTDTAHELAEGNIYAQTPKTALKQRSEIGMLAHAVNDMSLVYQDMIISAGKLFAAANVGRLDVRSDHAKFKGNIARFMKQINETLDAITLYLNSIPESIFIMDKHFEVFFRNQTFDERFGGMRALEIFSLLFPPENGVGVQSENEHYAQQVAQALGRENASVWINGSCFSIILKEIDLDDTVENSILVIAIDITDLMREKDNAQAAARAKSGFLSRMSHEMRTPMNAIIGMTKIAENTQDVARLKYCLETIDTSSRHLLGIINDVLDMSKIEAGKFELESMPLNIEKTLMKACNLIIDNIEKKRQSLNVILSKDLDLNYMGDELRLAQVLTNLLSNAIKFTPEEGKITLCVEKTGQQGNKNTLRFSITDTGIGMTDEQISRLWSAFEQADGSISRKFGGTGLGLAISKSIIEKMGGHIGVESQTGVGSTFSFEVSLDRASRQDAVLFDGIRPEDIRLLIVEGDDDVRTRFFSIIEHFGMHVDAAKNAGEALALAQAVYNTNHAYDIIFLDSNMPDTNAFDLVKRLSCSIDKNTIFIITTFWEWGQLEKEAVQYGITRFITKPLFPSSILDAINETIGSKLKSLEIKTDTEDEVPDFSGLHVILAEDVAINREIVLALLEPTNMVIDCAENGALAVDMFAANPARYDIIFMDIQMPEMNGLDATRAIRALNIPRAKTIPIVAMTANAFKEDIDQCIESGMNDHLAKPIDIDAVFDKVRFYCGI